MKFQKVIGLGGIGSGMFFALEGNHTLGREESRLGLLTDYKDYCKQHVILHYIARIAKQIKVISLGMVGDDMAGKSLLEEMEAVGICTKRITITDKARTMLSICFSYPDGSGGNITTSNSACNLVNDEYLMKYLDELDEQTIVIAAPEIPLAARNYFLKEAKARKAYTVASVLVGEVEEFEREGGYSLCDILSVNLDEAAAIARMPRDGEIKEIVKACATKLVRKEAKLIVTCGKKGCVSFANGYMEHIPVMQVPVASSAGAGDALIGGTVAGLINGLPFQKGHEDSFFGQTMLTCAVEFGSIVSNLSVQSPHTIAHEICPEMMKDLIQKNQYQESEAWKNAL